MRVSRLYVADALVVGRQIKLQDEAAHYVRTVLRLKKGQEIALFNGQKGEYSGRLAEVSRKNVSVAIDGYQESSVESSLTVILGMGISRGDRMDWAVQKAVELGVSRITPIVTERCVIKLKEEEKKQHRLQHWRNIVQHAAEQSGRTQLPAMPGIEDFGDWIGMQQGKKIFLDPHAVQSLTDCQPVAGQLTLLTGPEGGFSEHERELARAAGFVPVRLGGRILRTETAALAALAAVQTLWGDFV